MNSDKDLILEATIKAFSAELNSLLAEFEVLKNKSFNNSNEQLKTEERMSEILGEILALHGKITGLESSLKDHNA